ESYLQAIRQIQPRGPYLLAGYSYGGLVAFDLACLLHEQGEAIDLLMLIDSTTNPRQWPLAVWLEALGRRFRNHAA
ncbi:thioesterase domain-containing protein, partial [Vibrio parahaemolyticus]